MLYKIYSFTKVKQCHLLWSALTGIYYIVWRWGEMNCSAQDAGKCGSFWGETALELSRSTQSSAQHTCGHQAADLHPAAEGTGRRLFLWLCQSTAAPLRALWNTSRRQVLGYLGFGWKNGSSIHSTPQAIKLLQKARVIIERGRCFLINYVNPAAAQPGCTFSNTISFVAQLLSVWWATADLTKLQFYSVVASDLIQTTL